MDSSAEFIDRYGASMRAVGLCMINGPINDKELEDLSAGMETMATAIRNHFYRRQVEEQTDAENHPEGSR